MTDDYIYKTDRIFFKHEVSENLPCDTYSKHTHNTYELLYFLDGDATHVIEDRKYKLRRGDLILIRPFQYHFIRIDTPARYERYDILFDAEKHGVESVRLMGEDREVVNLEGNAVVEELFRKCDLYYRHSDRETFEKILPHLLSELFYHIDLFPRSSTEHGTVSPLISKALRYMNDHLTTVTGIKEVAERLFVSESYLFRLFRKELHRTPKKYLMEKRLFLAHARIRNGEKPTRVCETCGFGDYTTFYRNYTALFGRPPSAEE